jgi:hypothetical protein
VVISTSTGASLATWTATQPDLSQGAATIVMLSPNYGLAASGGELLTLPWGQQIAELLIGNERSIAPRSAGHAQFWTTRYPTRALIPLAAMAKLGYAAPIETTRIPALFIFSDNDTVVRPDRTREIAGRWGGRHELVPVERSGDPDNHVLAGDVMSPVTTDVLADRITAWVKAIVQ